MKKAPMVYRLRDLQRERLTTDTEIGGKWVPARPLGLSSLWWRVRCAWLAFTGKCDLVRWPRGQ